MKNKFVVLTVFAVTSFTSLFASASCRSVAVDFVEKKLIKDVSQVTQLTAGHLNEGPNDGLDRNFRIIWSDKSGKTNIVNVYTDGNDYSDTVTCAVLNYKVVQ